MCRIGELVVCYWYQKCHAWVSFEGYWWSSWCIIYLACEVGNWRSRCLVGRMVMHACQIGPTDTAPPCSGSPQWTCVGTKGGMLCGRQTFCPHFYSSVRMVRLHSPFVLGSIRISGLDGKLAVGCLRSGPAWIVFCFRCWVADGKKRGGDGEVRHWVLGLPRYLHFAAHCQSDKSDHLVASFCAFQHNWNQTVRRKRQFAHLFYDGHCLLMVQLKCRTLEQVVPGVIISPSSIAIGALGAFHQLHAEQVGVECPLARHH